MKFNPNVIDLWVFRRGQGDQPARYLLLQASKKKADRWFGGAQFWQIPSELLAPDDSALDGIGRLLQFHQLTASALWVVEHTYTIYNRRFEEVELISVFAAEVAEIQAARLGEGHSDQAWLDSGEAERRLSFRGLKEGLHWLRHYVSENESPGREFKLA